MRKADLVRVSIPVAFWNRYVWQSEQNDEEEHVCKVVLHLDYAVTVEGNASQIKHLRQAAEFFDDGNIYHDQALVQSAKAVLFALRHSKESVT